MKEKEISYEEYVKKIFPKEYEELLKLVEEWHKKRGTRKLKIRLGP
jgi:hypothetical protein